MLYQATKPQDSKKSLLNIRLRGLQYSEVLYASMQYVLALLNSEPSELWYSCRQVSRDVRIAHVTCLSALGCTAAPFMTLTLQFGLKEWRVQVS